MSTLLRKLNETDQILPFMFFAYPHISHTRPLFSSEVNSWAAFLHFIVTDVVLWCTFIPVGIQCHAVCSLENLLYFHLHSNLTSLSSSISTTILKTQHFASVLSFSNGFLPVILSAYCTIYLSASHYLQSARLILFYLHQFLSSSTSIICTFATN